MSPRSCAPSSPAWAAARASSASCRRSRGSPIRTSGCSRPWTSVTTSPSWPRPRPRLAPSGSRASSVTGKSPNRRRWPWPWWTGWQRRGVGTLLMRTLTRRAVAVGVRRLTIFVSPDNLAVLRMLARAPGPVSLVRSDRWSTEYAVFLDDAAPMRQASGCSRPGRGQHPRLTDQRPAPSRRLEADGHPLARKHPDEHLCAFCATPLVRCRDDH